MTFLAIAAGFLLFMGLIRAVYAVDDYALAQFGYAPFAMPNVLFMLIPHALLLLAIRGMGPRELWAGLAGAGLLAVFLVIKARTNGWLALFSALVQLAGAPILVFVLLFRALARPAGPD